jgi:hypothetical protein
MMRATSEFGSPGSLPFPGEYVSDEVDEAVFLVIGKLAGIEENSVAAGAGFVPDVVLLAVDHLDHLGSADGALDIVDPVEFPADLGVAGVDRFRPCHRFQFDMFQQVEPQAFTVRASLDLDVRKYDFLHIGAAFGAIHRNLEGVVVS